MISYLSVSSLYWYRGGHLSKCLCIKRFILSTGGLQDLEKAITTNGNTPTDCVTIPMSLDALIQVQHRGCVCACVGMGMYITYVCMALVCMCVYMYVCIYVCVYVCIISVYVCVYVCISVCVCMH